MGTTKGTPRAGAPDGDDPARVKGSISGWARQEARREPELSAAGRVRCGLCGRRMEGCHHKGSNWYRCQYVTRRGHVAARYSRPPTSARGQMARLILAATIRTNLDPKLQNDDDRPGERSLISQVAGAGSVRISPTTTTSYASGRTKSQKCASSHEQADFQPFRPRDTSGRMPRAPA